MAAAQKTDTAKLQTLAFIRDMPGPKLQLTIALLRCGAARRTGRSLHPQNQG